jgi:hypothetical protein
VQTDAFFPVRNNPSSESLPHFASYSLPAGKCAFKTMQVTLVDCPGHASLIRTVIGGAQIIDMMILVIDVISGVQTQTAECLVLGEILTDKLIVVLNKIDLFPENEREARLCEVKKNIRKVLAGTKFAGLCNAFGCCLSLACTQNLRFHAIVCAVIRRLPCGGGCSSRGRHPKVYGVRSCYVFVLLRNHLLFAWTAAMKTTSTSM